jgi:carbon storage regulator
MLVLTRRPSESIIIANNIKITVVSVGPGRVKLGIEAPPDVRVDRQEIHDRIEQSSDVLAAVGGRVPTNDSQNTLIGNSSDTAMIVTTAPATAPTADVPVGTPPPASGTTTNSTTSALSQNKLSKYRLPRKPR